MVDNVPAHEIVAFRERHNLNTEELDRLFGVASKGRTTRRWEAKHAPGYVRVLMAYADRYGLDLMYEIADGEEVA